MVAQMKVKGAPPADPQGQLAVLMKAYWPFEGLVLVAQDQEADEDHGVLYGETMVFGVQQPVDESLIPRCPQTRIKVVAAEVVVDYRPVWFFKNQRGMNWAVVSDARKRLAASIKAAIWASRVTRQTMEYMYIKELPMPASWPKSWKA